MRNLVCLFAATLALSLPAFAQTAPLGQFAPVPPLAPGEFVVGLVTLNSQLDLVTNVRQFTSPFAPATGLFMDTGITWAPNIYLLPSSQVVNNPANPSEIWLTGAPPRVGVPQLYRALFNSTNGLTLSTAATLPVATAPLGLASDGATAYLVSSGQVLKVDGTSGNLTFDSSHYIATPQAIVRGPDGLLYVLDSNTTSGQILVFDTSGNFKSSFALDQPSAFQTTGPFTVSSAGQLYLQSTDTSTSPGTLSIDSYSTQTGALLGRTSGANTFSADQGFNPGGHAAMFTTDGNLYYTTGTGQYIWLFSTGPRTPTALNCHGDTVSGLTHQYGSMAKAAAALGYPSVSVLQLAVRVGCGN